MTFEDFEGVWTIARTIVDVPSQSCRMFHGTAQFIGDEIAYSYHEAGVLEVPGTAPMKATQSYRWQKAGHGVEVFFVDGRAFHFVDLSCANPKASHDCPPDWYEVAYDFATPQEWRSTWRVRGPRKNYEMVSVFTRAT